MTYFFTIPELVGVSTLKRLHVGHTLHLTPEQRAALVAGGTVVVTGVSVPVWSTGAETSEPAQEVFCEYTIAAGLRPCVITGRSGYAIVLAHPDQTACLDDVRGKGSEWVSMAFHEIVEADGEKYPAVHQVVIAGSDVLDQTMFLGN